MPLSIGFDTRAAFIDPFRGFGRVTYELANALLDLLPGQLVLFVPSGASLPQGWQERAAAIVPLQRPRRMAFLFDGPAWWWTLRRHRVDVMYLPAWGVPPRMPVPVVATLYDATPFRFPTPKGSWPRLRLRMATRSLRRATVIHAISDHAANDVKSFVDLPSKRIHTVHLGVSQRFLPTAKSDQKHVLFVGGLDPHKNLEVVMHAYLLPGGEKLPTLVVAGPGVSTDLPAIAQTLASQGRLRYIHTPGDEELATLYQHALAVVIPSRNEGFGLPALEAMAAGCPVLAAQTGALPEVCGQAAVLLPPDQPESWRNALVEIRGNPERRMALVVAGQDRVRNFTWQRTARGLLELLEIAAGPSGGKGKP